MKKKKKKSNWYILKYFLGIKIKNLHILLELLSLICLSSPTSARRYANIFIEKFFFFFRAREINKKLSQNKDKKIKKLIQMDFV